jgi:hypothetical protein
MSIEIIKASGEKQILSEEKLRQSLKRSAVEKRQFPM